MIPSWHLTQFSIGPIPVNVWGLFVAAGFLIGTWLAARQAPRFGFAPKDVVDFAVWALVAGMIGARIGHVVFYEPAYYIAHPWEVFAIWRGGLSSFGGFVGALIAAFVFVRRRVARAPHASTHPFITFSDLLLPPFLLAWFIGRLGCYSIHDHPGIPCTGYFCVPFPDGTRRLDMGLMDGLLALAIVLFVAVFPQRSVEHPGTQTAVVVLLYGFGRLMLDMLRVGDVRYGGLTPAQYGSIALLVLGGVLLVKRATYHHP